MAKNYLSEEHVKELNRIVSAYLDLAENRAQRGILMKMADWASFLNSFLGLARSEKLAVGATVTACYLIANGSSGHAPMLSLAFRTFEFTRIARRTCFVP